MKIQIDGTNTLNRGAELMLVAVLEQLEQKYPESKVVYNPNSPGDSFSYKGALEFEERNVLKYSKYPDKVLRKLKLPRNFLTAKYASSKIDVVLDAGGFQFGDQWDYPQNYVSLMEDYYKELPKNGTKLIFLPQALGPFKTDCAQQTLHTINRYADLIIAREQVSYDYLIEGGADADKVRIYPDFTLKVKGAVPERLQHLQGKVGIIPNKKMITHTASNAENYLNLLNALIRTIKSSGYEAFLLNHESEGDLKLCERINASFDNQLEVVSGLDAVEVKGVIGGAYLLVSSRFHGVASALSQGVPCLSTSWNHKYQMLFKDYKLEDMVLDLKEHTGDAEEKLRQLLQPDANQDMRQRIKNQKIIIESKIDQMWKEVFKIMDN